MLHKLYFINSTFPPQVSGVGDHTANLAVELAKVLEIKILTAYGEIDALPDVKVQQTFSIERPSSIVSLIEVISSNIPDWVIFQYDPFSYGGRYGFNPYLPLMVNLLKRRCPKVRIGIIVHESFLPIRNGKSLVLSTWLKAQLWSISCVADVIFPVIEPWVTKLKTWFPSKTIQHLPVSSNIHYLPANRDEVRAGLGISNNTIVLGLFGRIQRTRSMENVIKAVNLTREAGFDVMVLYIGLDPTSARNYLNNVPLLADGPLTSNEISRRFAAMDIYLVPIEDEGISTRRTSLMTGLQHGVPTVATFGEATDNLLMQENGKAFLLADVNTPDNFANAVLELVSNPLRRQLLSQGAVELFSREFTWKKICSKLLATLESCSTSGQTNL